MKNVRGNDTLRIEKSSIALNINSCTEKKHFLRLSVFFFSFWLSCRYCLMISGFQN